MRKVGLILSLSIMFITGCASVSSYQDECDKIHTSFVASVSCLNEKVANNPKAKSNALFGNDEDPLDTLYLLRASELSELVRSGKLTDRQARIELLKTRQEIIQTRSQQAIAGKRYPPQLP